MKKVVSKILTIAVIGGICLSLSGCGSNTCDHCGEKFWGTAYYASISNSDDTACKDCAKKYWAPLNIENFKK